MVECLLGNCLGASSFFSQHNNDGS
jgi:hypothetical protein